MTTTNWLETRRGALVGTVEHKNLYPRMLAKRIFDLAVTIPALILLAPIMGLIALLVRTKLGKPVLFRQERPGLNGVPFTMVKFRSMTNERDENGDLLPDEQRSTRFGQLLRSTSLDELPELFNVLKGEMSLVGPRPLLVRYMPYYTERELKRFDVLPGITGLAQINGRNNLAWDQRFEHDVWYTENSSVAVDIKIMVQTLLKVVRREDIAKVPETALDTERHDRPVHLVKQH